MCDCDQSYFAFLERYKLNEGERYVLKLLSLQESGIGFRNILVDCFGFAPHYIYIYKNLQYNTINQCLFCKLS